MHTITLLQAALAGVRHRQAHTTAGTPAYDQWTPLRTKLEHRLRALEVGYAGGCPDSIVHEQAWMPQKPESAEKVG